MPRATMLAALWFGTACAADKTLEPVVPCTAPVQMTLTFQTALDIAWSPRCGVARIDIVAPPSQGLLVYWGVTSTSATIAPTVRYGNTPPGATVTHAPALIMSGATLAVRLSDANNQTLAQGAIQAP